MEYQREHFSWWDRKLTKTREPAESWLDTVVKDYIGWNPRPNTDDDRHKLLCVFLCRALRFVLTPLFSAIIVRVRQRSTSLMQRILS